MNNVVKFMVILTAFLLTLQQQALAVGRESLLTAISTRDGNMYRASLRFYNGGKDFVREVGVEVPASCSSGGKTVIRFQPFETASFTEVRKGRAVYSDTLINVPDDASTYVLRWIGFEYRNLNLVVKAALKTPDDLCEGTISFAFKKSRALKDRVYQGQGSDNFDSWDATITLNSAGTPLLFSVTGGVSRPIPEKPGFFEGRIVSCSAGYARVAESLSSRKSFRMVLDQGDPSENFGEVQRCSLNARYAPATDSYRVEMTFDYIDATFSASKTVTLRLNRGM